MPMKPRIRRCRRVQRNTGCWEIICRDCSESRFKQTFRISRNTFDQINQKYMRPDLERMTVAEEPVSPECRLAIICLYRLGRGDYPYTLAMTGFEESTVRVVVLEVCESLIQRLWAESVARDTSRKQRNTLKKRYLIVTTLAIALLLGGS